MDIWNYCHFLAIMNEILYETWSTPTFSLFLGKYLSVELLAQRVEIFNFAETACFPK